MKGNYGGLRCDREQDPCNQARTRLTNSYYSTSRERGVQREGGQREVEGVREN